MLLEGLWVDCEFYDSINSLETSTDEIFWGQYLADCRDESLSPVSISLGESNPEPYDPNGSIFGLDYTSTDDYSKKWAEVYFQSCDNSVARSNEGIHAWLQEETASGHYLALEREMIWGEWRDLMDEQEESERARRLGGNSSQCKKMRKTKRTEEKSRHQPARVGVTKNLQFEEEDCDPQLLVKLKVRTNIR